MQRYQLKRALSYSQTLLDRQLPGYSFTACFLFNWSQLNEHRACLAVYRRPSKFIQPPTQQQNWINYPCAPNWHPAGTSIVHRPSSIVLTERLAAGRGYVKWLFSENVTVSYIQHGNCTLQNIERKERKKKKKRQTRGKRRRMRNI